jgi:hypothetical protein
MCAIDRNIAIPGYALPQPLGISCKVENMCPTTNWCTATGLTPRLEIDDHKARPDLSSLMMIRTYAEEENCEAIFRRSGSEFIILRITNTENCTFFGQKMTVILHTNMVALETFFFQ